MHKTCKYNRHTSRKKNTHAHTYTHAYLSVPSFAYPVTNPQRTQGI